MSGWIKIAREINEHWIWEDETKFKWWVDLLISAAWEDKQVLVGSRLVNLKRGQLVASLSYLCKRWKRSRSMVEPFLRLLVRDNMIRKDVSNNISIITIVNYKQYQDKADLLNGVTANDSENNGNPDTDVDAYLGAHLDTHLCAHLDATNKEYKEDKNIYSTLSTGQNPSENFHEDWRVPLSSVRRSVLGFDKNRIAEYKRELFAKELEPVALKIGMPQQVKEAFIRWWTAHDPGNDKIKAEDSRPFDMEVRALSWMEKEKPRGASTRPAQEPRKSKLQQTLDERNKFQQALHGFYNPISADSTPDCQ